MDFRAGNSGYKEKSTLFWAYYLIPNTPFLYNKVFLDTRNLYKNLLIRISHESVKAGGNAASI